MAGTLFPYPRLRAFNAAGLPVPGARLYSYRAGTTQLADTFTTSAIDVPHSNPQIADGSGEFRAVYMNPAAGHNFRFVCQTPDGVQLWAEDNIPPTPGTEGLPGPPGDSGDPGLSVAELSIYVRSATQPETPSGGSFNFATQTLDPPAGGWTVTIPSDSSEPCWVSLAVAAAEGATGTDASLAWTTPVEFTKDGASVDIIFRRSATQPATPAPSAGVPAGWYSDVSAVPASSDLLWSSVGKRDNASRNWIWQLPIQVEGGPGPQGEAAVMYYIKPVSGTAIKNGSGTLTVEARMLFGGNDVLLNSGTLKLYVGSTEVTVANGFAAGSTGYIGVFDSTDISGSTTVSLKDGPAGAVFDTITLVDVIDGTVGGVGTDALIAWIEADGPIAWIRASDGSTWTPSGTTRQLDCTVMQGGVDVARVAWVITRAADGTLTGASGTHTGGDLNSARVTVTEVNEGSTVMTVKFAYSYAGDETVVAETLYSSLSGVDGSPGTPGDPGPSGLSLVLSPRVFTIWAYQNGTAVAGAFDGAQGQARVYSGTTDVTASSTFSAVATGCTGVIYSTGQYNVTAMAAAQTATLSISATYGGQTITEIVTVTKIYAGFEIVTSLPTTNNFVGRQVFLNIAGTGGQRLYRYTTSGWTRSVSGADIEASSVTTDAMFAGRIITAKIGVTQLDVLSTNAGTITAGILQSPSGNSRFDLTNARIIFNSAPGQTGGYVRVQGGGFGPSGNYLDWYGPKPAGQSTDSGIIANLTDSAALWFIKTDGTSRSAGRIRGEFEPKAWGRLYGLGTASLLESFNVAGVGYVGAGRYNVVFASALPNANYCTVVTAHRSEDGDAPLVAGATSLATGGFLLRTRGVGSDTYRDAAVISFVVFGSNVPGGSNIGVTTPVYGGGTIGGGYIP